MKGRATRLRKVLFATAGDLPTICREQPRDDSGHGGFTTVCRGFITNNAIRVSGHRHSDHGLLQLPSGNLVGDICNLSVPGPKDRVFGKDQLLFPQPTYRSM